MGDFPPIPTKEELYAKVNEWFYATNPDAPEPLHPTSSEHAEWRRDWIRHRDELLNAETNRIYWEAYPDAPHEIDPSNPAHQPYQKAWLDIRSWILDMTPEMAPPDADELERQQTTALENVYSSLAEQADMNILPDRPDDMRMGVHDTVDRAAEEIGRAYRNGLIGEETWYGTPTDVISAEDPSKSVRLKPAARVENGSVTAWFDY